MSDNRFDEENFTEEEIIDLSKYFRRLRSHWKTVLYWAAGAFVLGCVIALSTPRKYTVVTKLAPELSTTAINRISSLASLVGMSSSILGTTDAVYPMVYPELVHSSEFLADLFDVPVTFKENGDTASAGFYEYLTEHGKKSLLGTVMSVPSAIIGLFAEKEEEDSTAAVNPFHFTKKQGRVVKLLSKQITASIDKKTLVITISVTMQDALVAATISRAVNENLKSYVTHYRTRKALKDCSYYEKLHDEAQAAYYEALQAYSNYSDSHQGVSMKSYMIESERLKNEASLKYQLYTSTAQQLQAAKAKVQQETPVLAEIIPPTVPLKSANSRKKMALAFGLLGGVLGCGYVLWRYRKEGETED